MGLPPGHARVGLRWVRRRRRRRNLTTHGGTTTWRGLTRGGHRIGRRGGAFRIADEWMVLARRLAHVLPIGTLAVSRSSCRHHLSAAPIKCGLTWSVRIAASSLAPCKASLLRGDCDREQAQHHDGIAERGSRGRRQGGGRRAATQKSRASVCYRQCALRPRCHLGRLISHLRGSHTPRRRCHMGRVDLRCNRCGFAQKRSRFHESLHNTSARAGRIIFESAFASGTQRRSQMPSGS